MDYSQLLNSIINKNIGQLNEWKPFFQRPSSMYEALIYYASPFWFCNKIIAPDDFISDLVRAGREWKVLESDEARFEFIQSRMEFYAPYVNGQFSDNFKESVGNHVKLSIIIYYWLYTKPLSEIPNNDMLELMPTEFSLRLPALSTLIVEVNKLDKL